MGPFDAEDRQEMIRDFVNESRELLDEVEPQIIELEQTVANAGVIDRGIINSIFRLFHTIKGSASFLDLMSIMEVTHEAETLLDLFRVEKKKVTSQHVDLFCRALDFIRNVLDQIEKEAHDQGFEETAKSIKRDLSEAIASAANKSRPDSVEIQINSELIKRFVDDGLSFCEEAEAKILALEQTSDTNCAEQVLQGFGNFKGNAAALGFSGIEKASHLAEKVLRGVVYRELNCDGTVVTVLLTVIDSLRTGIRRVNGGQLPELPEIEQVIHFAQKTLGLSELKDPITPQFDSGVKNSLQCSQSQSLMAEQLYSSTTANISPGSSDDSLGYSNRIKYRSQFVRVDTGKLDELLDLVGELVIAEAMVSGQSINPDDAMGKAIKQMDKITKELQDVALSLRMVPLTATFRKMVRLVRDLAHKEKKQVKLEVRGQETEVDKTVIELISDPLIHLIRNAVDHGIEEPGKRRKAGKPETGKILIEARHSTGEVWIIVKDDGCGLNREKILEKGIEQGIITEDESKNLSDEQVWQLIFTPGFSTVDVVSDISGRGVGMDVVKENVEQMKGRIDVYSTPDRGTAFVIKFPLNLAIIEGMIVRVGQNRYTIPISSIKESFQPTPSMITCTHDQLEIVHLRGELLPVLRLHQLYHIENSCDNLTEGILIAVQHNDREYCLFVDELMGQRQIVIKGLPGYLKHVRGISGCAILSDGDVCLILDIADLFDISQSRLSI